MSDVTIRSLSPNELAVAIDWAAAEGWNPGLGDAALFRAADPEGFLGLFLPDGSLAASISVVRYGEAFGFLGLYITRPDQRGKGFGWQLWRAGMAFLGDRTVGLDGVVAQQANYARSGFVLAHRNMRWSGIPTMTQTTVPEVRPLTAGDLGAIAAYEAPMFQAPRRPFLEGWLTASGHLALGYEEAGAIRGYAVVRPCRQGRKIGPLFADAPEIARALAASVVAAAPGEVLVLDPPEPNRAASALAESLGLAISFETARMYKAGRGGAAPTLDLARIFGITTFELG